MRVELPRLLSVLAHELRGPLSVIQGYLRLMLNQRDSSHADTPMIRAMLDATGRLAALGRQASDVAIWTNHAADAGAVDLAALADKTARLVPSGSTSVHLDQDIGREAVSTSDPDALAAALAALAELAARDTGGRVELSARSATDLVTVVLTPADVPGLEPAGDGPHGAETAATSRPLTIAFDRGGFGLSLVLASYVLDAHGADVRTADSGKRVEVQLQKAGGSR
jgi:nitrogen-specific signal transduction histidine kinase